MNSEPLGLDSGMTPTAARPALRLLAFASVALLVLWNAPWIFFLPRAGLDPSWQLLLSRAAVDGKQWGHDVIFTYGPYLDLMTRLLAPEHLWREILLRSLLLLLAIAPVFCLVPRGKPLYLAAYMVAAGFTFQAIQDTQFLIYPFLFSLLYFKSSHAARWPLLAALCGVGGLIGLIKLSYLVPFIFVLGLADLDRLRQRRLPWFVCALAVSFLFFYRMAAQELVSLPGFFAGSLEIIKGYGDAMSLIGTSDTWVQWLAYCALAIPGVLLAARQEFPRSGWRQPLQNCLFFACLLAVIFIGYKSGFTRQDPEHNPTAWTCAGLALLLYFASYAGGGEWKWRNAAVAVTALVTLASASILPRGRPVAFDALQWPLLVAVNLGDLAAHPAQWAEQKRARYDDSLAMIRERFPLPPLEGSVGMISSNQAAVIANGLQFRSMPVIQEYSTYTHRLNQTNSEFIRGDRAPDHLLFSPGSIDNRWPASIEGPLWPDLLSRYAAAAAVDDQLLLRKRPQPAAIHSELVAHLDSRTWEVVDIPASNDLLFAKIHVHRSLLGSLFSLLYAPSEILLQAKLVSGVVVTHRLVPGIADDGFLLSPYVPDPESLARVFVGDLRPLDPFRVEKISVVPNGILGEWKPSVEIDLYRLTF